MAIGLSELADIQGTAADFQSVATAGGWVSGEITLNESNFALVAGSVSGDTTPTELQNNTYSIVWSSQGTWIANNALNTTGFYSWTNDIGLAFCTITNQGDQAVYNWDDQFSDIVFIQAAGDMVNYDNFGFSLPVSVQPAGGGCFLYGTKVEKQDGTIINIEDTQLGDWIKTYNAGVPTPSDKHPEGKQFLDTWYTESFSGHIDYSEVRQVRTAQWKGYFVINSGSQYELKVTFEHRLFVKREDKWAWRQVIKLQIGDKLFNENEEEVEITSINFYDMIVPTIVLDVEDIDAYFANGIWAKNAEKNEAVP